MDPERPPYCPDCLLRAITRPPESVCLPPWRRRRKLGRNVHAPRRRKPAQRGRAGPPI